MTNPRKLQRPARAIAWPARVKLAAIVFIAILAGGFAAAEDLSAGFIAANGDVLVSKVTYSGNRRTRVSALDELTGLRVGMRLSEIDPEAVKQSVLKSNIFSEVELTADLEDGGASITVAVKEKWTFIPIPSGGVGSGGSWSAGLILLEYNFLGLRKTLVLGGTDSNLGLSGLLAYSDPRFLHSKTSFRLFADAGRANKTAQYMDGTPYASFMQTTADGGISLVYPSEGKLTAELDLTLRYSGVSSTDAAQYGLYENSLALIPAAVVNYDGRLNVGYRNAGPSASATYQHGFHLQGLPSNDAILGNAELDFPVFLGGYLEVGAAGRYGDGEFQSLGSLSGPGYRTLPYSYSFAPRNAVGFANLALPLIKLGWTTMELGPFYEAGVYATGLVADTFSFFHGPGLLYRLYLRDIALPAIEISAAYNVPVNNFVISANVGVSI